MECYEAMEARIKARRTAKRTEKRKKDAQAMLETEESWKCNSCAIQGHTSRMTLVAEECRKCGEKRPASLKQKAEDFKQSEVGRARKATKRGRKKVARTWTDIQWAQYQEEELEKAER